MSPITQFLSRQAGPQSVTTSSKVRRKPPPTTGQKPQWLTVGLKWSVLGTGLVELSAPTCLSLPLGVRCSCLGLPPSLTSVPLSLRPRSLLVDLSGGWSHFLTMLLTSKLRGRRSGFWPPSPGSRLGPCAELREACRGAGTLPLQLSPTLPRTCLLCAELDGLPRFLKSIQGFPP